MKELTKMEERVLIGIWKLGDEAYGVNIQRYLRRMTGKSVVYGTLYTTFEQLVRKGYINKRFGEPTAVRGGKSKIYFIITDKGLKALEQAYENQSIMWEGITADSFRGGGPS